MVAPTVTLSLPELNSLCQRAARGAGYTWGLAEDYGFAATWLSERRMDGADIVLQRLTGPKGAQPAPAEGRWINSQALCGLTAGVTLADFAALPEGIGQHGLVLGPVLTPVITLPFIAQAAKTIGCGCDIILAGEEWGCIGTNGAVLRGRLDMPAEATVRITRSRRPDPEAGPLARTVTVAEPTYRALTALALRMTVPTTDGSQARAGGVGPDDD